MKYKKLSDLQKDIETLDGKWELSPEHEVSCRERGLDKEATIKGSLVAAEPDALVVSVTVQEELDSNPQWIGTASARAGRSRPIRRTVTGLVKLSGRWELDEKNRIAFSVKRGLGKYDTLTFQGAWEVNDNHEVVYSFESKQVLEGRGKKRRRVTRVSQELVFKGEWDISEKNCLTYLIGVDNDSAFRFRGTFETQSILAKEGEIRYQAGIEYKTSRGAKRRLKQTIVLFGKWKLSDDLALSLELECANGKRSEIRVGTEFNLKKLQERLPLLPDEVTVNLTSTEGDPLGVELVLTKDLFDGNAQTFVRFRESLKETAVEAGVKIPW
ncbi:MAG: hypothetical protein A2351_01300 [Omnitrophica bacterium RIFOXYB12_FULL_50_7]|nr:MAG: hypothetical protein A2351_01300 [Omnitrophica bacterium RIFOXYB12_FULL_50_7]